MAMLPSGVGVPGRLMAVTTLGELFTPGRTLMAEVVGTEGGRAVLRFSGGEMLDVATRTPLAAGTRVVLQVGPPPQPGAPLELRLVWATSGVEPGAAPAAPEGGSGQAQELSGGAAPTPPGTFRTAGGTGTYRPAPGALASASAAPAPGLNVPVGATAAPGRVEAGAAGVSLPAGTEVVITLADAGEGPSQGETGAAPGPRQEVGGLPPRSGGEGATGGPGTAREAPPVAGMPPTGAPPAASSGPPATHGLAAASGALEAAAASAAPAAPVLTTATGAGLPAIWLPIPLPGGRQAWVQLVGDEEETPRRARGARAAAPAARIYWDSPELGPVSATLDLTGGEEHPRLRTHFALGQAGALQELQQALPDLAAALARVGFPGADLQARITPGGPAPLPGSAGGRLDRKA